MDAYGTTADIILDTSDSFGDFAVISAAILLPSLAVDAASGSMFELQPNDVVARLIPIDQSWRDQKPPE